MLVKHNLFTGNIKNIMTNSIHTSKYDFEYRGNCIFFKGREKPGNNTVFKYNHEKFINYYSNFTIKNIGKTIIIIESPYINGEVTNNVTLYPGENVNMSRKNVNGSVHTWVNIPNIDDFDDDYAIEIVDFMITESGYSDIYLPNINSLPTNKQPLLPPEGDYKEIQPMRG